LALVIHGTGIMPDHMRNGPRQYIYGEEDYLEAFNYIDDVLENGSLSDENNLEEQSTEQVDVNNIDPTILAEVEKELQRIHHRMLHKGSPGDE
jgi:hypothetical protein